MRDVETDAAKAVYDIYAANFVGPGAFPGFDKDSDHARDVCRKTVRAVLVRLLPPPDHVTVYATDEGSFTISRVGGAKSGG